MIDISRETIFALASAPGPAGIAVFRVSGPRARHVAEIFDFRMPCARVASLRRLSVAGRQVDEGVVVWFDAPNSFTGEATVELSVHGGRAVYDSVFRALDHEEGFRPAVPGEFSRRAVLNGRLDLTAAEAINDLVNAETEAQQDLALQQMAGKLADQFNDFRKDVLAGRAQLEAYIDFTDQDLPGSVIEDVVPHLARLGREMRSFLDDGRRGERLRSGLRVAVVGRPNAGKSSFVNWLAERDVAIVSEHPGTTRDVLEVQLDLGGYPVIVADTAGLRAVSNPVEKEGIARAKSWAQNADLRIVMLDASDQKDIDDGSIQGLDPDLILVNKIDLEPLEVCRHGVLGISVTKEMGLAAAVAAMTGLAKGRLSWGGGPIMTRERHRSALTAAAAAVERAGGLLQNQDPIELAGEELRFASEALGRVTGHVDVEAVLDIVFRDFCIGK